MLIQRYLNEGLIDTKILHEIDWSNRMLELGFILGVSEKTQINTKVLESIYLNTRLNPSIRVTSILRSLESLNSKLSSINPKNKELVNNLIDAFDSLSSLILTLKPQIGSLQDSLSKTYTKTFSTLLEKCALSLKLTSVAIQAHKNNDLIQGTHTILFITLLDYEKLDRLNEISPKETIPIIRKSCEHIFTNKLRAGDPLSILTFILFFEILKSPGLRETDVQSVEEVLEIFKANFSPKQKNRLIEVYLSICTKLNTVPQEGLIKTYQEEGVKIKKLENRVEEGKLKLRKVKFDEEVKEKKVESVELMFEALYYDIEGKLTSGKRVDVDDLVNRLRAISEVNEKELYDELEYYSYNDTPLKSKSLLWRLISKAISNGSIFTHEERNKINKNIDSLVHKSETKRRY